jgi:hypothetical protein
LFFYWNYFYKNNINLFIIINQPEANCATWAWAKMTQLHIGLCWEKNILPKHLSFYPNIFWNILILPLSNSNIFYHFLYCRFITFPINCTPLKNYFDMLILPKHFFKIEIFGFSWDFWIFLSLHFLITRFWKPYKIIIVTCVLCYYILICTSLTSAYYMSFSHVNIMQETSEFSVRKSNKKKLICHMQFIQFHYSQTRHYSRIKNQCSEVTKSWNCV